MTLDEGIDLLTQLRAANPGTTPLYVSIDGEGNEYRPLTDNWSLLLRADGEVRPFDDEDDENAPVVGITLWPA